MVFYQELIRRIDADKINQLRIVYMCGKGVYYNDYLPYSVWSLRGERTHINNTNTKANIIVTWAPSRHKINLFFAFKGHVYVDKARDRRTPTTTTTTTMMLMMVVVVVAAVVTTTTTMMITITRTTECKSKKWPHNLDKLGHKQQQQQEYEQLTSSLRWS